MTYSLFVFMYKRISCSLCCYSKFINALVPDTLDERVINVVVKDQEHKVENWNLCLNSGKAIGCVVHDIRVEDLIAARPDAIGAVIWEIVKVTRVCFVNV